MLDNGKGGMFSPAEKWRVDIKMKAHMLNQQYNALTEFQPEERKALLRELLGELNENVTLQGPITFHYGRHTKIGRNTSSISISPARTMILSPSASTAHSAPMLPSSRPCILCWPTSAGC